jgi:hypothetical protein
MDLQGYYYLDVPKLLDKNMPKKYIFFSIPRQLPSL